MSDDPRKFKIAFPFRGMFVNVAEPRAFDENVTPKYSITAALPKGHPFFKKTLQPCIEAALVKKFEKIPESYKSPVRDGDKTAYGWEGLDYIQLFSDNRPGVAKFEDGQKVAVDDFSECYSGRWYKATGSAWAWEYKSKKGVSLNLHNLFITATPDGEDDTRIGGKASVTEDFADEVDSQEANVLN